MISQTSSEMNANTNPPEYVISIHINKEYLMPEDEAFLNGWEKWSLEDIIPIFNSANWRFRLAASGYFGEIVFLKLLEAAHNPNIPFELIEEVVHTILHTGMDYTGMNIFESTGFQYGDQVICDFFKEFVKHAENDARYYNLIYEILTYQTTRNKSFPLGFRARRGTGWNEEVFAKLPSEMQRRLSNESFYTDGGNTCCALLSDASVGM